MAIINSSIQTTRTLTYKLTGDDILTLIPDLQERDSVSVEFYVPSGGDYSSMALSIDKENPVVVTVRRTSTGESE